jgi:hypothetical protein
VLHIIPAVVGALPAAIDLVGPLKAEVANPLFAAADTIIGILVLVGILDHLSKHGTDGARHMIAHAILFAGGPIFALHIAKSLFLPG